MTTGLEKELVNELSRIQNELFHLGSDLCFLEEDKDSTALPGIEERPHYGPGRPDGPPLVGAATTGELRGARRLARRLRTFMWRGPAVVGLNA